MSLTARWLIVLALLVPVMTMAALSMARPTPAAAHPLGNFTVNRYSRLELYSDAVRVRYVLDMAEIPAFQEITEIDTNGDGELAASENAAYLARKQDEIVRDLQLVANGSDLDLGVVASNISYPEGQAGLRTLRLGLILHAPLSGSSVALTYNDDNYAERIGWKEVIVRPAQGVTLAGSDVSSEDVSDELTSYPADLLSSPLDISSASLSFTPGSGAIAPEIETTLGAATIGADKAPQRAGGGFASLIDSEDLTLPVILLSLLLALGFGAIHALEPGHGKTFVAAYFVGVRGTVRQALALGLIVATTHTIGVLAIGLVALFGSQYILPERIYPYLSLVSGLMVLALGVRLIATGAGGRRAWHRFAAVFRGSRRSHDHRYAHGHDHDHSHEPLPGAPPWKSLLALGLADGVTPSPSALIVLLAAVSLDRIGLGVLLIVAFSAGLAAVLTLVSLGLLYARRCLEWLGRREKTGGATTYPGWATGAGPGGALLRAAPLGGALLLVTVGLVLTMRALTASGLAVF